MGKGRISDWVEKMSNLSEAKNNFQYKDNKLADQKNLRSFNLPCPESISFYISKIDHEKLNQFFDKHSGIFLRVIPDDEGLKRGLKKRFTFGSYSLNHYLEFIDSSKKIDDAYHVVEFQEWEEDSYGWILISDGQKVIAEISKDLDALAHHSQVPLSTMIAHVNNFKHKIEWIKKDPLSAIHLEKALRLIITRDGLDYFLKGYFEGLTTISGKNYFFDYKQNPLYNRI